MIKSGTVQTNTLSRRVNFSCKTAAKSTERVPPVDRALLFGDHGLKIGELEEAVVEVVQVQDAHQQEGGGDEDPGEQHGQAKGLQAQVVQAAQAKKGERRNTGRRKLSLNEEAFFGGGG